MKERPILFSAPMVRAILEGRKTQTRRVVKIQPCVIDGEFMHHVAGSKWESGKPYRCPHGRVGDQLWVRETLQTGARNNPAPSLNHCWRYAADNQPVMVDPCDKTAMIVWAHHKEGETCVSIHMPRWASRIQLEITDVSVERVAVISESDAMDEGAGVSAVDHPGWDGDPDEYRKLFHERWDILNAKRGFGWDKNPWVWALSFKRIEPAAGVR